MFNVVLHYFIVDWRVAANGATTALSGSSSSTPKPTAAFTMAEQFIVCGTGERGRKKTIVMRRWWLEVEREETIKEKEWISNSYAACSEKEDRRGSGGSSGGGEEDGQASDLLLCAVTF